MNCSHHHQRIGDRREQCRGNENHDRPGSPADRRRKSPKPPSKVAHAAVEQRMAVEIVVSRKAPASLFRMLVAGSQRAADNHIFRVDDLRVRHGGRLALAQRGCNKGHRGGLLVRSAEECDDVGNDMALVTAFRSWFGLQKGTASVLVALFRAAGTPVRVPHLCIHLDATRGSLFRQVCELRRSMGCGAIAHSRGEGYALTQSGLEECRGALQDLMERLAEAA